MGEGPMSDPLTLLSDEGVAVWLDDMSREGLVPGNLKALVRDKHVVGVTTNPTIFLKAITGTDVYDAQMANLAALDISVAEGIRLLTTHDVRAVCDLLRPVYDGTDRLDGRVSIEVDPGLAEDTKRTAAEAEPLWWMVNRDEPDGEDPGDRGRPSGNHRCPCRGYQRQRHAHLLRRAVRDSRGRLSRRPGAGARRGS
jgi:hypothetical protein